MADLGINSNKLFGFCYHNMLIPTAGVIS